jgi:transposase, IS5 family
LAEQWKPMMVDTQIGLMDATVYESYIKYPTGAKLLSDCIEWLHKTIMKTCKAMRLRQPRSKYKEIKLRHLQYSKSKKKTYKKTRKLLKSLLYLCNKLIQQLEGLNPHQVLGADGGAQLKLIKTVLEQQTMLYEDPKASIPNRRVSLFKPYIRPIVRGKENKPVEFGAKVHLHQVGGCNFIEHLSFDAFHEGNRLPETVLFHAKLFGKVTAIAGDGIYPTNANRRFCRENQIATNFVPKGREGQDKEQKAQMRSLLGKARATRLEGSFGNEKNHYLLRKVKARSKETEIAWILFGIQTANAVKIAKAIEAKKAKIVNRAA